MVFSEFFISVGPRNGFTFLSIRPSRVPVRSMLNFRREMRLWLSAVRSVRARSARKLLSQNRITYLLISRISLKLQECSSFIWPENHINAQICTPEYYEYWTRATRSNTGTTTITSWQSELRRTQGCKEKFTSKVLLRDHKCSNRADSCPPAKKQKKRKRSRFLI